MFSPVEPAALSDAGKIHALLVEVFADSSLPFSIYQSRNSIEFIRTQILESSRDSRTSNFQVVRWDGELAGFYNAVVRKEEYFINYMAVRPEARQHRAGDLLMTHYEDSGAFLGCKTLGLDVFRRNKNVTEWFERRGYTVQSRRFRCRFELSGFARTGESELEIDSSLLRAALAEESVRGFSSVACRCAGIPVQLGLIAGTVCNVMQPRGRAALPIAGAAARYFGGGRRSLLAALEDSFDGWPAPALKEEVFYMTKCLP